MTRDPFAGIPNADDAERHQFDPPPALPAGFAASPNLTYIEVTAWCSRPGCAQAAPCAECRAMLQAAREDALRVILDHRFTIPRKDQT